MKLRSIQLHPVLVTAKFGLTAFLATALASWLVPKDVLSAAFVSLWRYASVVERQLPRIEAPILIIHSEADRTIPATASQRVYEQVSSPEKELVWFERSGHEMLRDSEAAQVLERIEAFILAQVAREPLSGSPNKE